MVKWIPFGVTLIYALWSIWMYCTSSSWYLVTPLDLFTNHLTPVISCAVVLGIYAFVKSKKE